jgi:lipoprotein-releasing system ATP-binding protein
MLIVENLIKEYPTPSGPLRVLSGINLTLSRGDAASIMGPSGSGKSTLLYVLGALEPPTSGTVKLDGNDPFQLQERDLAAFRNQRVGFVFQDHCLLPQCSAFENVLIPTFVADTNDNFAQRARLLLGQVGLENRMEHRPGQLSGGEKQRAALARALIREPLLILCDEPTGNLDRHAAEAVISVLLDLHRRHKNILVVVTHNPEIAARFPLRLEMFEGELREEGTAAHAR